MLKLQNNITKKQKNKKTKDHMDYDTLNKTQVLFMIWWTVILNVLIWTKFESNNSADKRSEEEIPKREHENCKLHLTKAVSFTFLP